MDLQTCIGGLIKEFSGDQHLWVVYTKSSVKGIHPSKEKAWEQYRWLKKHGKAYYISISKVPYYSNWEKPPLINKK